MSQPKGTFDFSFKLFSSYNLLSHDSTIYYYTSEFESHWVPLSYGLVPHLSKKLSKFPLHHLLLTSYTGCGSKIWNNFQNVSSLF